MTDVDLLAQKLAFIETCVRDLRTLARPKDIVEHRLGDLAAFLAAIGARLR